MSWFSRAVLLKIEWFIFNIEYVALLKAVIYALESFRHLLKIEWFIFNVEYVALFQIVIYALESVRHLWTIIYRGPPEQVIHPLIVDLHAEAILQNLSFSLTRWFQDVICLYLHCC